METMIDWTKPQHHLRGIEAGLASVAEVSEGWLWQVKLGKHSRSGVRKSQESAKRAAEAAMRQLTDMAARKTNSQ